MKRNLSFAMQAILLVLSACILLAISGRASPEISKTLAWAAPKDVPASQYRNVVVVAKSGGDFASVQKALDSIGDNFPTNHYLIWVAPGIYTETVILKPYIDIEGAGELVTKITSTGGSSPNVATVTAYGYVNDAELRYLTVENTGGNNAATAIYTYGASPSFLHITASASGGNTWNNGFYLTNGGSPTLRYVTAIAYGGSTNYGMNNMGTSPTVIDSVISGSGGSHMNYAMYNFASSPTIRNSKLSATGAGSNYAVANYAYYGNYSVTIDNSTLTGSTSTIFNHPLYVTRVGASKLEGGAVLPANGTVTCAGVYDGNYVFFSNTCP